MSDLIQLVDGRIQLADTNKLEVLLHNLEKDMESGRLLNSGQMSEFAIKEAQEVIAQFRSRRDAMLKQHVSFEQSQIAMSGALTHFDNLLKEMGDMLEAKMDAGSLIGLPSDDVQTLWDTSAAMMDIRVSLLRRAFSLEHIVTFRKEVSELRPELDNWLKMVEEGLSDLFASADAGGPVPNDTVLKGVLQTALTQYKDVFDKLLADFDRFKDSMEAFEQTSNQILDTIEKLDGSANLPGEAHAVRVDSIISVTNNTLRFFNHGRAYTLI